MRATAAARLAAIVTSSPFSQISVGLPPLNCNVRLTFIGGEATSPLTSGFGDFKYLDITPDLVAGVWSFLEFNLEARTLTMFEPLLSCLGGDGLLFLVIGNQV